MFVDENVMSSTNHSLEIKVIPNVHVEITLVIGQVFDSLEDATKIYENYATEAGFNIYHSSTKYVSIYVVVIRSMLLM